MEGREDDLRQEEEGTKLDAAWMARERSRGQKI